MKLRIIGSVFLMIATLGAPAWGGTESSTTTVKTLIESVRAYKKAALSAEDRAANTRIQKVMAETLALPDLAQKMLGPQWEKLNAGERKNFTQLLAELLQKIAYPKSAEFFSDLRIEYTGEKVNGTEAVVDTQVTHPQEGLVAIEYHLDQKNGRWIITDILLDGVSLMTSVRTQMQQVIAKESYQGLIKRMRERLAQG